MDASNHVRKALDEADLDDLLLRLYLYTRNRLTRMFWRGQRKGQIPGGLEAEDFIQTAIKKALGRDRIWKPEESTLFEFLKNIISSDINNLAEKVENKIESRAAVTPGETDGHTVNISDLQAGRSDWPDICLLKEQETYERELIQSQVGDNPLDQAIIRVVIENGLSRSADIAAELGVPVSEIYKAKRRIRRKCQFIRETEIKSHS